MNAKNENLPDGSDGFLEFSNLINWVKIPTTSSKCSSLLDIFRLQVANNEKNLIQSTMIYEILSLNDAQSFQFFHRGFKRGFVRCFFTSVL